MVACTCIGPHLVSHSADTMHQETGSDFIRLYYSTRSELASLAHSFISVPHIIVHVLSRIFTYIFVRMRKLAYVHILPDCVTCQSASSRNSLVMLVVLQLRLQGLPREDA